MNPTSISQVRVLLSELGVHPSKRMGQCFMVDRNTLDIMIGFAEIDRTDQVLEIGPGLGALTERLAPLALRVVAIEKDGALYEFLKRQYDERSNVELVHADMLNCDISDLCQSGINKIVSNLPYSSGSRMLVNAVRSAVRPEAMVVTLQKEVADRLVAGPGGRDYGILSVWTQLRYDISIAREVSPTCFWPKPAVESAIVVFRKHSRVSLSENEERVLYGVTKHLFMHRRKQLATALRSYKPFIGILKPSEIKDFVKEIGIEATARPESVSINQWCELASALTSGLPL